MTQDFTSPKLVYNAKKWPLLMAEAKNARLAFAHPPLLPVRGRYDAFVRHLATVGSYLIRNERRLAYSELKAAGPDLRAYVLVAKRAHLACHSGSTVFYIA